MSLAGHQALSVCQLQKSVAISFHKWPFLTVWRILDRSKSKIFEFDPVWKKFANSLKRKKKTFFYCLLFTINVIFVIIYYKNKNKIDNRHSSHSSKSSPGRLCFHRLCSHRLCSSRLYSSSHRFLSSWHRLSLLRPSSRHLLLFIWSNY